MSDHSQGVDVRVYTHPWHLDEAMTVGLLRKAIKGLDAETPVVAATGDGRAPLIPVYATAWGDGRLVLEL